MILSESVLFIDIVIIIIVIMSVCSYKSALQISLSFMQIAPDFQEDDEVMLNVLRCQLTY